MCAYSGHTAVYPDTIQEHQDEYHSSQPNMSSIRRDCEKGGHYSPSQSGSFREGPRPPCQELARWRYRCLVLVSVILLLCVCGLAVFVVLLYRNLASLRLELRAVQDSQPDIVRRGVCVPCTLLRLGSPEENAALDVLGRYSREDQGTGAGEECRDRGQFETLIHTVRRIPFLKSTSLFALQMFYILLKYKMYRPEESRLYNSTV